MQAAKVGNSQACPEEVGAEPTEGRGERKGIPGPENGSSRTWRRELTCRMRRRDTSEEEEAVGPG